MRNPIKERRRKKHERKEKFRKLREETDKSVRELQREFHKGLVEAAEKRWAEEERQRILKEKYYVDISAIRELLERLEIGWV